MPLERVRQGWLQEQAQAGFCHEDWKRLELDCRQANWQLLLACFKHSLPVGLKEINLL